MSLERDTSRTDRTMMARLLAGVAGLTVVGSMAFVIAASASSSGKPVRMTSAAATGATTVTPTGARLQGEDAAASAQAASGGIISMATNGLKGLAPSAVTAGRADPSPTRSTGSTTSTTTTGSTTTDDKDDDASEPGFAAGTVASVSGTGFTLTVAGSTTPRSVATSASTVFILTAPGTVAGAAVGSQVLAIGTRDPAGALAATKLAVLPATGEGPDPDSNKGAQPSGPKQEGSRSRFVVGQVTANSGGTLTVTTPSGPQTVTTSSSTTVTVTSQATLAAVTVGATVQVTGTTAADGSLAARLVHVGALPMGRGGDDHDGLGAGLDREVGSTHG